MVRVSLEPSLRQAVSSSDELLRFADKVHAGRERHTVASILKASRTILDEQGLLRSAGYGRKKLVSSIDDRTGPIFWRLKAAVSHALAERIADFSNNPDLFRKALLEATKMRINAALSESTALGGALNTTMLEWAKQSSHGSVRSMVEAYERLGTDLIRIHSGHTAYPVLSQAIGEIGAIVSSYAQMVKINELKGR